MKTQSILVLAITVFSFGFVPIGFGTTASFQGLGRPGTGPTDWSTAYGVSADGSVVVGRANYKPFRWTAEGGLVLLESLLEGYSSGAHAVSGDGQTVVGSSVVVNGCEAFRWTAESGTVGLGYLSGSYLDSRAFGVSADGSVVVGWGKGASGYYRAFRWTTSGGMQELPTGGLVSYAEGASDDGAVVVGRSDSEAFRWAEFGGIVGLGDLPGGVFWSGAKAVSPNGSVVVGYSSSASSGGGNEAFRWTAEDGMVGLGDLPGGDFYSVAKAVSGDGSVVVGSSVVDGNVSPVGRWTEEAFMWDPDNAMRNIKDVLENDFGLDLTGWMLYRATGISDDGSTIVGSGTNPNGYSEGWIATIPEPATTYYVDALNGDDDNDGLSPETAFATIQKGIDSADDGDTVIVVPGTYTGPGNRDIDFLGKAITVRSVDPNDPNIVALTIIDGSSIDDGQYHNGFYFHSNEDTNSMLLGLSIKGFSGSGIEISNARPVIQRCIIYGNEIGIRADFSLSDKIETLISDCSITHNEGIGIGVVDANVKIHNCVIANNEYSGVAGFGGCGSGIGDLILENCSISRNGYIGLDLRSFYGSVFLNNCSIIGNKGDNGGGICSSCNLTVENSIIAGNYSTYRGGAIVFYDRLTIRNCTIVGNFAERRNVLSCNGYVGANIENSIICGNYPDSTIRFRGNYNNYISYSNVEGGINSIQLDSGAILNWGSGNIDIDPCFVQLGYWDTDGVWVEGDYHLLRTSLCIDAANDANVYTDIEGNIRPFDFPGVDNNGELPEFDMGAYEATAEEAELMIMPRTINRHSQQPRIMAWVHLPEGITRDQIDCDTPLVLYPSGSESIRQFVFQNRRRGVQCSIFAFFDKAELMDAVGDNSRVELELQVVGQFVDPGRYFYGSDTVRIKGRRGRARGAKHGVFGEKNPT